MLLREETCGRLTLDGHLPPPAAATRRATARGRRRWSSRSRPGRRTGTSTDLDASPVGSSAGSGNTTEERAANDFAPSAHRRPASRGLHPPRPVQADRRGTPGHELRVHPPRGLASPAGADHLPRLPARDGQAERGRADAGMMDATPSGLFMPMGMD